MNEILSSSNLVNSILILRIFLFKINLINWGKLEREMNRIFGMRSKILSYVASSVCLKSAPSFAEFVSWHNWVDLYNFLKKAYNILYNFLKDHNNVLHSFLKEHNNILHNLLKEHNNILYNFLKEHNDVLHNFLTEHNNILHNFPKEHNDILYNFLK